MTVEIKTEYSNNSPMSLWFRNQHFNGLLPSSETVITDVDFLIRHLSKSKASGKWHIEEVKSHMSEPEFSQWSSLSILDSACRKGDINFCGVHIIQFGDNTPDDSKSIFIDGIKVTKEEYLNFCAGIASKEIYENNMSTYDKEENKILQEKRRNKL